MASSFKYTTNIIKQKNKQTNYVAFCPQMDYID
jgi:hypothetical protein